MTGEGPPRCTVCGSPRGGARVYELWHAGWPPDVLCLACWRWGLLWNVGQGPAADRILRERTTAERSP